MENNYWSVTNDKVLSCSKVPDNMKIWILPVVQRKIDLLMKKYASHEWLAYCIVNKDGIVVDLVIPKQTVTSGSVTNVEQDFVVMEGYRIGGVIHSHNNMEPFFSDTDKDFLNENHGFSIVVSHSKGYKATVRLKTPCGAYIDVPANIEIKFDIEFDEDKFLYDADKKIYKSSSLWDDFEHGQLYLAVKYNNCSCIPKELYFTKEDKIEEKLEIHSDEE